MSLQHLSEQAVILDKKVGSATTEGSLDDSILDVDPTQMNLDDEKMKDYLSRLHALEEKNVSFCITFIAPLFPVSYFSFPLELSQS